MGKLIVRALFTYKGTSATWTDTDMPTYEKVFESAHLPRMGEYLHIRVSPQLVKVVEVCEVIHDLTCGRPPVVSCNFGRGRKGLQFEVALLKELDELEKAFRDDPGWEKGPNPEHYTIF